MRGLLQDWKHALRLYQRAPLGTSIAVAVLAVGMAFVTAFLSLYVDLTMRPVPGLASSHRLVTFGWMDGDESGGIPLELIDRIAAETTTLEVAAGALRYGFQGEPADGWVRAELVTSELFASVRPHLALGRWFEAAEHAAGGDAVAVISYDRWQREFDGREDVLGKTVALRGPQRFSPGPDGRLRELPAEPALFRVIGVAAPEFAGVATLPNLPSQMWLPLELVLTGVLSSVARSTTPFARSSLAPRGVGRKAIGASAVAVERELNDRYLDELRDLTARPAVEFFAVDGIVYDPKIHNDAKRQLGLFLTGGVLLAFTAAANVSLFLLTRAAGRRRELGIRMAVGAPLKRLAHQLTREAALLVLVAAGFGIVLSVWLAELLRGSTLLIETQWRGPTLLDWRAAGLVGAFLLVLTLLVSLAPLIGLGKLGIVVSTRQVSARAGAVQRIAGTAQTAIAGAVGGAAVAFGWYLGSLMLAHPGYETRELLVLSYSFAPEAIDVTNLSVDQARRRETLESLPDVAAVSLASNVPAGFEPGTRDMPHPDDPSRSVRIRAVAIDGRYVDLLGLELLHGRGPTDGELGVALVNRTLARELFGRDDVVGETLALPAAGAPQQEIVGVLGDVAHGHPSADIEPTVFLTGGFILPGGLALIESALTVTRLREQIQSLIDAGALEITIDDVTPLAALRADRLGADRARGALSFAAAIVVVAMAAFGFYGTQQYLVAAGRREYAIRASIGAGPRALGVLVLARGLMLAIPGLALGAALAFFATAWLRDGFISRDVSPLAVAAAVAAGLALVLLASSAGPALQVRRGRPAPLLRED